MFFEKGKTYFTQYIMIFNEVYSILNTVRNARIGTRAAGAESY
jgi:hypothetical protein